MARVDADRLIDPELICLAASLALARRVEAALDEFGVEYAVEVEAFARTLLSGSVRYGAAFYVSASQAAWCRSVLAAQGLGDGVVEAPAPDSN
jgi:hypothetical protein